MEITRATNALKSTISTVVADTEEILHSGNYYCTEEIARELNAIRNGLEHLRLDGTLLGSDEWQESFNPRHTAAFLAGATSVLDTAAARLFDYKSQLGAVSMGQKQENDAREMHQWAMTTLLQIQQDLTPYTYGATDRIRQFGDHIGVTDRYTGYRNNLTRGSRDPIKMQTVWMEKGHKTGFMNPVSGDTSETEVQVQPPQLETCRWGPVESDNIGTLSKEVRFSNDRPPMTINRGYRTIDSLYPRSNTFVVPGARAGGGPNSSEYVHNIHFQNDMNAALASCPRAKNQEMNTKLRPGSRTMSVQEQAGINTTFPGRTEYMQRYIKPVRIARCSDLLINPTPNLKIYGRPLGEARYDPRFTEYQNRYEWPDGEKISKRPWLRK